jgi:hypothetical protein
MEHLMLRQLFQEWTNLMDGQAVPERSCLSPAAIAAALPDTLMLAFDPATGHPIRLAGSRVCALFGRELRGQGMVELFDPADRDAAALLIGEIAESESPALATLIGPSADHGELALELLLLPLRVDGARRSQMLCGLAAPEMPWWLAGDPIRGLRLRSVHQLRSDLLQNNLPQGDVQQNGLRRPPFRSFAGIGKGAA